MKNKELRYKSIIKELAEIKSYPDFVGYKMLPNVWKSEQLKILKQTISRFIVDYKLQDTELFYFLQYQINQI